ncbi:MAG: NAD(P)H-hydrate epimerase [Clostridiales Family XIII bacterium]|jgi:NAD(P)H-hydrate epimerase|nr:NAD(P)H-hydrate epimerase [Clostridiales Family XIII bacterium]
MGTTEIITAAEMKRRDEHTINEIGIPSMVLMERAALAVADELLNGKEPVFDLSQTLCVCGAGNNGGDGMAVARILHQAGTRAEILLADEAPRLSPDAESQLRIARRCGVPIHEGLSEEEARAVLDDPSVSAIIDAIFGIGLSRPVEGRRGALIEAMNRSPAKVLSIDAPSGVSADTGEILGVAVKADKTVTLAFMKRGLTLPPGREAAGNVVTRDIGVVG